MASNPSKKVLKEEEEARKREEAQRAEEERTAAEREFMEQFQKERRLSSSRAIPPEMAGGYHSGTSSVAESESEVEKQKKRLRSPEDKEKEKKKKTRKTEDPESEEEEEDKDPLKNLEVVLEKMKGWFKQPTIMKMVTKPQTEKFGRYLSKLQAEVIKAREERARLEARIEERAAIAKIVREELKKSAEEERPTKPMGYAEVAARNIPRVPKVTGVKGPVLPPPKRVIVRSDTMESEEVKATMKRLVKPQEIGLKVRRLINIRNGVIVEAENEEGVDNLMKQKSLVGVGLKIEKPTKKRPVIMVYDVNAELTEEEVKEEVFCRNMQGSEIAREQFNREFEVRHKYKDSRSGGKKNHIVAECSVGVRNWLRRQDKIFVEWQCCRVKDYVDIARCFKCQRFGHIAKHCTSAKPSCSYCAGEHDYKDCTNKKKKEAVCCVNCKREGRGDLKHEAGSRRCPAYERAVKRNNEKIDYGL